jgi:hypothetical protein
VEAFQKTDMMMLLYYSGSWGETGFRKGNGIAVRRVLLMLQVGDKGGTGKYGDDKYVSYFKARLNRI